MIYSLTQAYLPGGWIDTFFCLLRPAAVPSGGHCVAGGGSSGAQPDVQPAAVCQDKTHVGRITGSGGGQL